MEPRAPLLYELPKVHKEGVPCGEVPAPLDRPHTIQLLRDYLLRFIAKQMVNHVGKTITFVKNSKALYRHLLVSFNKESLFTKVIISGTMGIISEILNHEHPSLTKICLDFTYLNFGRIVYEQKESVAMGWFTTVSSSNQLVRTNSYVKRFEKMGFGKCY